MSKTQLNTKQVQTWLQRLGYYDGKIGASYRDAKYRAALKRFQRDYRSKAGTADGWYGKKTESALLPLIKQLESAPCAPCIGQMRKWLMTEYYIGKARSGTIPMKTPRGGLLANVSAGSFVEAALEGTTILPGGEGLANVASGPSYLKCNAAIFAPVYNIAKRNKWLPSKAGYAGIRIDKEAGIATAARTFSKITPGENGWPIWNKIEASPFRTMATDIGRVAKSDPRFKGKGGLVPVGTRVFVLELVGLKLPHDGSIHDGWVVASDCGSAIFGLHGDLFVGTKALSRKFAFGGKRYCHVWWDGMEEKVPFDYTYGL